MIFRWFLLLFIISCGFKEDQLIHSDGTFQIEFINVLSQLIMLIVRNVAFKGVEPISPKIYLNTYFKAINLMRDTNIGIDTKILQVMTSL